MFQKKPEPIDVDKLLKTLENNSGNDDVKRVLHNFIEKHLIGTTGILLIWTEGNHVDIEGSHFTEPEAVWILEKAKMKTLNKVITF